jgi:hypothetical protein
MTQEVLNALAQFMQRVQLTGKEVPAWNQCMAAIGEALNELQKEPTE